MCIENLIESPVPTLERESISQLCHSTVAPCVETAIVCVKTNDEAVPANLFESFDIMPSTDAVQQCSSYKQTEADKIEPDCFTNNGLGMILVFFSVLCFSFGNAFVNIMGVQIPVLQIVFIRGISQLFLALLLIASTSRSQFCSTATWIGAPKNWLRLLSRALFGVAAVVTAFTALQVIIASDIKNFSIYVCFDPMHLFQRMPLADATAINYLNIPFTAALARLFLKEPYWCATWKNNG